MDGIYFRWTREIECIKDAWARSLHISPEGCHRRQVPEIRQNKRTPLALLGILGMTELGFVCKGISICFGQVWGKKPMPEGWDT